MPPLIRRYIKTSFAFLIAGVLLGSYVSVGQFLAGAYPPRLVITAHVHLLLVGAHRHVLGLRGLHGADREGTDTCRGRVRFALEPPALVRARTALTT